MAGFKEILKHSRNYMVANLATKALAFISIPVYTRLLTPEEYGIVSIFLGLVAIFNNIFAWGCDCAVSRYFFDKKDIEDFKDFVGTSSVFASIIFLVNSIIFILFANKIADKVGLPVGCIYLIIPVVLFNVIGLTHDQIYGPLKESGRIAKTSLLRVLLNFVFSIIFILLISKNKYYGQIIGLIFSGVVLLFFWIKAIKPYFIFKFKKEFIRYILIYSIPLIPYSLSGVLIEQFAKISLGKNIAFSDAGYYSLALSIAGLTTIVISIAHQAWNPYYFEYMNEGRHDSLDKDLNRIYRLTIIAAGGIAAFGNEIGLVLARANFTKLFYLIPILVLGYVFYQLAYVYMRNFGYSRRTIFSTITVLISSVLNICLNIYLLPIYQELGAAISLVISYMTMAVVAWVFNKYFLKCYYTSLSLFVMPTIIAVLFLSLFFLVNSLLETYWLSLLLRFIIFIVLAVMLLWNERVLILDILIRFVKRL